MSRAGAFFDLDRTLMAGSSGVHFGRAAYRSGMVSRGQMTRWAIDHLRFRLRGSTDSDTDELVRQVKDLLDGVPDAPLIPGDKRLTLSVPGNVAHIYMDGF